MEQQPTNDSKPAVTPAHIACEFMKRTDLKGGEVEAYAQTYNWLQGIIEKHLVCVTMEEYQRLLAAAGEAMPVTKDPVVDLALEGVE